MEEIPGLIANGSEDAVTGWINHLLKLSSHYTAVCDGDDFGNCFPGEPGLSSHMPNGDGYFGADEGVDEDLLESWVVQIDEVASLLKGARDTGMKDLNAASEAHQNAHAAVVVRQAEQSMIGGNTGLTTGQVDSNGDADVGIDTRKKRV